MTTSTRRAHAGHAARSAGERLEADLVNAYLPPHVYLRRTSPAYAMHHIGGRLTAVVLDGERGCPDFHASVNGRAVVMEVKSTTDARWKLRQVVDRQGQALGDAMRAGVTAGVLLRYDATQAVYWLPWRNLRPWWIAAMEGTAPIGRASLTEEHCAGIGVRVLGLRWWDAVGGGA